MRLAVAALLALVGSARAEVDAYTPVPMAGPFPSIEAYCSASLAIYTDPQVRALLEPRCADSIQTIATAKVAAPYEELRVVKIPETSNGLVAVKLGGAWYLRAVDPIEAPPNCHGPLAIDGVTQRGDHALQIAYAIDGSCERHDFDWTWRERGFVVVGVGRSRAPSMTPPLRLVITETDETEGKPHRQRYALARSARWRGDGSVDIANIRSAAEGLIDEADPVGHHRFAFP